MNGYTHITINGNKVGLKFAFPAIKWFTEEAAKSDLYFIGDNLTDYGIAKILQCAYRNNCLLKEVDTELIFGDFTDFVDSCVDNQDARKELETVLQVYADSSVGKKMVKDDEEKKSLQPTETITG